MDILATKTILVVTITTMAMKLTVPMINSRTVTTINTATTSTTITILKAAMKNKMVMMGAMYSLFMKGQRIGQFMNHSSPIHPGHLFLN